MNPSESRWGPVATYRKQLLWTFILTIPLSVVGSLLDVAMDVWGFYSFRIVTKVLLLPTLLLQPYLREIFSIFSGWNLISVTAFLVLQFIYYYGIVRLTSYCIKKLRSE